MKSLTYSGSHGSPPEDVWKVWRESAEKHFKSYQLEILSKFNDKAFLTQNLPQPEITFLYEIAHSTYNWFIAQDGISFTTEDAKKCMTDRGRIGFAYLANCGAHNKIAGSISEALRKGQTRETAVLGYVEMDKHLDAWKMSYLFQEKLFTYFGQKLTIGEAFDEALADYPEMKPAIKLVGDRELTLDEAKKVRKKEPEKIPLLLVLLNLLKILLGLLRKKRAEGS